MTRAANAITITSEEPFVAEISDCLMCGASVQKGSRWYESGIRPDPVARYRLCFECVSEAGLVILLGGVQKTRWQKKFRERLALLGDALDHRTAQMLVAKSGTRN